MLKMPSILMIASALFLGAGISACKSKKEKCMEEAKFRCFGETMSGEPQKFIGNQPVGCKTSVFEHCMQVDSAPHE